MCNKSVPSNIVWGANGTFFIITYDYYTKKFSLYCNQNKNTACDEGHIKK